MQAVPGKHAQPKGQHAKPKEHSPNRRRNTIGGVILAMLATFILGSPVAQANQGGEHPSITDVNVTDATCLEDGALDSVQFDGDGKDDYVYSWDVVGIGDTTYTPGNGFTPLSDPSQDTSLPSGTYKVILYERHKGQNPGEEGVHDEIDSKRFTVGRNCVTVEANGNCETVTVTYTNPTKSETYFGDVRIDGEAGESDQWSSDLKGQGPDADTVWGLRYTNVDIPADEVTPYPVSFEEGSGEHTVAYRVARGPEREHYSIAWDDITVDCGEPEGPQDGQDGTDGEDGSDGADGQDGADGADGEDGQAIIVPTRINTGR